MYSCAGWPRSIKGIVPQSISYRLINLIFWIVMGCGIARFGWRGLKTTKTWKFSPWDLKGHRTDLEGRRNGTSRGSAMGRRGAIHFGRRGAAPWDLKVRGAPSLEVPGDKLWDQSLGGWFHCYVLFLLCTYLMQVGPGFYCTGPPFNRSSRRMGNLFIVFLSRMYFYWLL